MSPQLAALLASILGSSMAFLDSTVVNLILPVLQRQLGASQGQVQWVVEAYLLTLTALLLVGGSLADRFGAGRVLGAGVLMFGLASLGCGLAPDLGWLLALRALQGAASALLTPASLSLLSASHPGAGRGKAIGIWSAATAITAAIGPLIGGLILTHASWRWIFFINLPLAALALLVLGWAPRADPSARPPARPDLRGAALATLSLGSGIEGLTLLQDGGSAVAAAVLVLLAAVAMAGFLRNEGRVIDPMLPLEFFRSRAFTTGNLLTLFLYAALGGITFFLPFLLIGVHHYPATLAGAALLPMIAMMVLLSGWAGHLADRFGPRWLLTIGPMLCGLGCLGIGLRASDPHYASGVLPGLLCFSVGLGLTVAPLTTSVMNAVPSERGGMASAINTAVARAAGLVTLPPLGLLLAGRLRSVLAPQLDPGTLAVVEPLLPRGLALTEAPGLDPAVRLLVEPLIPSAYTAGFTAVTGACAVLCFLAATIGLQSLHREPGSRGER